MIGRGPSYPMALEAALKVKEVSYVHAEGFAGGELKHGVIALIEPGTPCLVLAPNDETHDDILSGAMEVKARGGMIIGIGPSHDEAFDFHIPIADLGEASGDRPGRPGAAARLLPGAAARPRPRQAAQPRQERHRQVADELPSGDGQIARAGSGFLTHDLAWIVVPNHWRLRTASGRCARCRPTTTSS